MYERNNCIHSIVLRADDQRPNTLMTRPKTMDELNVFELHQKVPKQRTIHKRKNIVL